MNTKQIVEIQKRCLEKIDDDTLAREYAEAVADFLKSNKINDEIITIILGGIEIDRATNFFDYLESISKNEVQDCWKIIKNNTVFKANTQNSSLKILSGLIFMILLRNEAISTIAAGVFSAFVTTVTSNKNSIPKNVYKPIVLDYCLAELPKKNANLPGLLELKVAPAIAQKFITLSLDVIQDEKTLENVFELKNWLRAGEKAITSEMERERIEAKIPKSALEDLQKIVAHYTEVEQQLRDGVYREEKLQKDILALNDQIADLNNQKAELEARIRELKGNVKEQEKTLAEAGKEIEERKAINDAFDALKKNDESALLRDIANELKAEYRDFKDSESDEMDIQLGEIYKEKIINIFKILEKKGIRVE